MRKLDLPYRNKLEYPVFALPTDLNSVPLSDRYALLGNGGFQFKSLRPLSQRDHLIPTVSQGICIACPEFFGVRRPTQVMALPLA